MSRKNLIRLLGWVSIILLFSSIAFAQDKLIIFVKPFQAKGVPAQFASNATELFRSELSATNRMKIVSEEEWQNVMRTQGIFIRNPSVFDKVNDQQIGRLVSADKLITGSIESADAGFLVTVNWVDLVNGIIDKIITKPMADRNQLGATIKDIILEIEKMFVSSGKIVTLMGERIKIRIDPQDKEWQVGTVFNLKKPTGYIYGKVRIERIDRDAAIGLTYELQDFLNIGDLVELAQAEELKRTKPNIGLVNFEGSLDKNLLNDLYVQSQTQLKNSNRFNLYDASTVADVYLERTQLQLDYIFSGEIIEDKDANCYTITIRAKDFKTDLIKAQDTEKCAKPDLAKTAEILMHTLISQFPLSGRVIKLDQKQITIDLGTDQNIRPKLKFILRSGQGKSILAEGKIHKVHRDHATIKQHKKYNKVRLGALVEMQEDNNTLKRYKKERRTIQKEYKRNYDIYYKNLKESEKKQVAEKNRLAKEKREAADKKRQEREEKDKIKERARKAKIARILPKSRLKFSGGKIYFDNANTKTLFNKDKVGKFNAALYLGDHPNFNIFLNYEYGYFEDNTIVTIKQSSYIAESAGILGARIQIIIPFLFSMHLMPFAEGGVKYAQFTSKLQEESKIIIPEEKWKGFYSTADAGLEIVFNRNFAIFVQAGLNRVLKQDKEYLKFNYFFIDAGMAIWMQ